MADVNDIVAYGFGSWSTVNSIPTLGFGIGVVVDQDPVATVQIIPWDFETPSKGQPSLNEDKLEQLFASSETMQKATGKTPAGVRNDHIFNDYSWYMETSAGTLKALRPLIVFREEEITLTRDTMEADRSQGNIWTGATGVVITANAKYSMSLDPKDHKRSKRAFVNFIGLLIDDIEGYAGRDDNAGFASMDMLFPFTRTSVLERSAENDFWEYGILVRFGMEE